MDLATEEQPSSRRLIRTLARHWKRLFGSGLALFLVGSWAWWALQLWGLPDIGDPFDVASFLSVRVADDRNAFIDYSYAASLHKGINRKFQANNTVYNLLDVPVDWAHANPTWRDYLAQSTETLRLWRLGAEKPEALYDHPGSLSFRTSLELSQELRSMSRLAVVEGMRLEAEGDVAAAWGWYRAVLRSSRHSGQHGFQIERLVGATIYDDASKALNRWATNPKVDAALLRRALDELIAIDAMTVTPSETIKTEYLLFVAELDDPFLIDDLMITNLPADQPNDWCQDLPISVGNKKVIQGTRLSLAQDRERSLRLARLMTANWLAEVEKPPSQRSKVFREVPTIYEVDPPGSQALSAEKLSEWLDSSLLAIKHFRWLKNYVVVIDRERVRQAKLVENLANELSKREHGQLPRSPD